VIAIKNTYYAIFISNEVLNNAPKPKTLCSKKGNLNGISQFLIKNTGTSGRGAFNVKTYPGPKYTILSSVNMEIIKNVNKNTVNKNNVNNFMEYVVNSSQMKDFRIIAVVDSKFEQLNSQDFVCNQSETFISNITGNPMAILLLAIVIVLILFMVFMCFKFVRTNKYSRYNCYFGN
jgi:hypothetical protein